MKFNINHEVRVRLTAKGREIVAATSYPMGQEDGDGWSTWQLWVLMQVFGGHIYNGCQVPFETTIELLTPNVRGEATAAHTER